MTTSYAHANMNTIVDYPFTAFHHFTILRTWQWQTDSLEGYVVLSPGQTQVLHTLYKWSIFYGATFKFVY